MATYEMICTKCNQEYDIEMRMSEYGKKSIPCMKCLTPLERHHKSPPNFKIPSNMTFDGQVKVSGGKGSKKEKPRVPINIIDEKPDGSYKVSRIGPGKDHD
jgi:hypothetical protein